MKTKTKIVVWLAIFLTILACRGEVSQSSTNVGTIPTRENFQEGIGSIATLTLQTPVDIREIVVSHPPEYQSIKIGLSNKADVLNLKGEPNVSRTYQLYESLHYFNSGVEEYFLLKEGIVQAVTSTSSQNWLTYDGEPATIDDLSEVFGRSEVITPTFGLNTGVYPEYGIAFSISSTPFPYQFFAPRTYQEYKDFWGDLPLGFDPFPLIPSVESVGIKVGSTTRDDIVELLGPPDRIVFENPNSPWVYYSEPDMMGRLTISFNINDIVENMSISPIYEVPKIITLQDVVDEYGTPDTLQLLPDLHGQQYDNFGLLYLELGLRVMTNCISDSCDIVKRDSVVNHKWYFEPMTLEDYKLTYSVPAGYIDYVDWHGFDE